MYSLSALACAHMHRTGMRGCVQHGEDIVLGDVALTVFQLCPRLYCNASYGERSSPLLSRAVCGGLPDQPHTHMYNTCCTVCACPLEMLSLATKMQN